MANILNSAADIVNDALVKIGQKNLVASLYEGSMAAQLALAIYGQTRDDLLRKSDWGFAQRSVNLSLLKTAPADYLMGWTSANPPPGWSFEYAYPDDCLKVRSVKIAPIFVQNPDPQYNAFSIANDSYLVPPVRVILTNVPNALLNYTGRVTDPKQWSVDFSEAFADALGAALVPALGQVQEKQAADTEKQASMIEAATTQG